MIERFQVLLVDILAVPLNKGGGGNHYPQGHELKYYIRWKVLRGTNTACTLKKATYEDTFVPDRSMTIEMEVDSAPSKFPKHSGFERAVMAVHNSYAQES